MRPSSWGRWTSPAGGCSAGTWPATDKVGTFDTELAKEFWLAFTRKAGCTLHLRKVAGENSHHILEGVFKAAGRSLKQAVALTGDDDIPSTKGSLV